MKSTKIESTNPTINESLALDPDSWSQISTIVLVNENRERFLAVLDELIAGGSNSSLFWLLPKSRLLNSRSEFVNLTDASGYSQPLFAESLANWEGVDAIVVLRVLFRLQQELKSIGVSTPRKPVDFLRVCNGLLDAANSSEIADSVQSPTEYRSTATSSTFETHAESDLRHSKYQWIFCEMPLTVAFALSKAGFPDQASVLAELAKRQMKASIHAWLDHDGLPHARVAAEFGTLMASWARCNLIAKAIDFELDEETKSLLEWAVGQFFRASINGKGLLLGAELDRKISAAAVRAILQLTTDQNDIAHAARLFKSLGREFPLDDAFDLGSPPSAVSEWGETAFLRANWKPSSPVVGINFSNSKTHIQIARRQPLIQGDMSPTIFSGDRQLAPVSATEVVCWNSDEDVDTLELQTEYEDGILVQRQIVFGREDDFLLIGDAISQNDSTSNSLRITTKVPLAGAVSAFQEGETNEVYLKSDKILAMVIPLSCGEWKADKQNGVFEVCENVLELRHEKKLRHCWTGFFFDLRPKRASRPRTWRRLTVAENRRICTEDEAIAFRIQIGKSQWVMYRALSSPANRTFFGENLHDEFFLGRYSKSGTETLVKIQ